MKVRELYNLLQERYPITHRDLNALAWPLHQPTLDVQFIDNDGRRCGPVVVSPSTFLIAEPLSGPFYDLKVEGLAPILPLGKFWKGLRIVVKDHTETLHNDNFSLSSVLRLRIKSSELKGLASELGIQWYHVNFDFPWHFTCFPKLDDCVKYERKTNKGSV